VDELRTALELATDDELRDLTQLLFRRQFNPLDYVSAADPLDVQSLDWADWIDALDQRFRFLAADGLTVLQGKSDRLSYRHILIQVCRHLHLPYQGSMTTTDLEAEIFLHLLQRAWKHLPSNQQSALTSQVQQSLSHSDLARKLPLALQKNPMGLVIKGSSAIALSSVLRPLLLRHIGQQFALHAAQYQIAQATLRQGSLGAGLLLKTHLSSKLAQQGMAVTAARYGAARSVLAFAGPALWGWFVADLGWRTISTNYGRIIPIIFTLAQIRLTRSADELEPAAT
jgi:uncharacterized protein YaaW (UPF0174 family)